MFQTLRLFASSPTMTKGSPGISTTELRNVLPAFQLEITLPLRVQTRIVSSCDTDMILLPSAVNATAVTVAAWPSRVALHLPDGTSQTFTALSVELEIASLPSGLKTRLFT